MPRPGIVSRVATLTLLTACVFVSSCELLIHPERNGQINTGRLDPSIVILDAVGLLFFVIPAAVAFAVDFSTGTIYLPDDEANIELPVDTSRLVAIGASAAPLTRQMIEALLGRHTKRHVDLSAPEVEVLRAPISP